MQKTGEGVQNAGGRPLWMVPKDAPSPRRVTHFKLAHVKLLPLS